MPVVYETEAPLAPRTDLGPYREQDYLALPDEPRCELLYGRLVLVTSPTFRHQKVVVQLVRLLADYADVSGGEVSVAPMDVRLADHSIVQPDVLLVTKERSAVIRERVHGAPDLVIEILSPATARRDLGEKLRLYAESGIAEYWIVDPGAKTFEFLENGEGGFRVRLPDGHLYRSRAIAGLEIDLEALWRSVRD